MLRRISTVSVLALFAAMTEPAAAQGLDGTTLLKRMNKAGEEIERLLGEAEQLRLEGKCDARNRQLERAVKIIAELEGYQSSGGILGGDPERTRETRARAQAIYDAPCPPVAEAQPAQPPVAVAPPAPVVDREPGQTRTLEDLQIEYAATLCGAEQEAAKQRLLIALRRAIDIERNPAKRDRLLALRDRIAARPVKPCDGSGNPTTGVVAPPTPPPVPADGPPPSILDDMGETAPPRTSLDVLRERLDKNIETCGNRSEFFSAKRALIEEIERRLGTETDPSKLADLRELHRRYSGKLPSECPPPPEAPKAGPTGALPADGSPLGAVAAVAEDRRARLAKRAAVLLNIYYLASLIPKAGIGVRRDGAPGAAPEKFAGETPRRANGLGISVGFQTKIAPDIDLRLRGDYGKGDGVSDVSAPASSASQRVDTGAVYGRLSNSSSGIIAGFGGTGRAKVELEQWGLGAEVGWKVAGTSGSPIEARITAGVDYSHIIRDYDMSIASSGTSSGATFSFDQTRDQRLKEDFLGLTVGAQFDFELCKDMDLQVFAKGGPYHVDTRFLGTERNTANFGPAPNRDFTLDFNEKDGRWGGRFEAGTVIEYRVSDRLSITGRVRYEYRSDVGAIDNPNSGDQVFFEGKTSGLSNQDWSAWDAGVGLKLSF